MAGRGENKQDLEHLAALSLPHHELQEKPSLRTKGPVWHSQQLMNETTRVKGAVAGAQ